MVRNLDIFWEINSKKETIAKKLRISLVSTGSMMISLLPVHLCPILNSIPMISNSFTLMECGLGIKETYKIVLVLILLFGLVWSKEMMGILLKLNNFIVMNRKILMERNMNVLIKTKMNMTIVSLVVKMEILSAFN